MRRYIQAGEMTEAVLIAMKNSESSWQLDNASLPDDTRAPHSQVSAIMGSHPDAGAWEYRGQTLLSLAAQQLNPSFVKMLAEGCSAACEIKGQDGNLPVHLVVYQELDDESKVQAQIECLEVLANASPSALEIMDAKGRTVRQLAGGHSSAAVQQWSKTCGAFLGRYRVVSGPDIHRSATARAQYATDEKCDSRLVCLKHMQCRHQFEAEVKARYIDDVEVSSDCVIRVLGWHTPADEPLTDEHGRTQQSESTPNGSTYPYVLVMERGERSLHAVCASERIAGYNADVVVTVILQIALCIATLHESGICHGDLKQRNILRRDTRVYTDRVWILCDMDASARIGDEIGLKTSSAYAPPELAQQRFTSCAGQLHADPSFDVWSIGVILFELCAGRSLFSQDINNDELVELEDQTRLCAWHTISDEELDPVFAASGARAEPQTIEDAKNLIRWCLLGNPNQRPTLHEIISHRLLNPAADPPRPLSMKYHAFISHAQADASGTAAALYLMYKKRGVHTWVDMHQNDLTLTGMRRGVMDSAVFVLILTEHVLGSWYCQQEMRTAIEYEKHVQIVVEAEPRFNPFDVQAWVAGREASDRFMTTASGQRVAVPPDICKLVDDGLHQSITYRRRDYEVESMMRELCRRSGLSLPQQHQRHTTPDIEAKVFVICNVHTSETLLSSLQGPLESSGIRLTQEVGDLESADYTLLVLTTGVLHTNEIHLMQAIALSKNSANDTIVVVYDEATWQFDSDEIHAANPEVQQCIKDHEAIVWRKPDPDGPNCHEFPSMVVQLLKKLNRGSSAICDVGPDESIRTASAVRERLAESQRLAQKLQAAVDHHRSGEYLLSRQVCVEKERANMAEKMLEEQLMQFEAQMKAMKEKHSEALRDQQKVTNTAEKMLEEQLVQFEAQMTALKEQHSEVLRDQQKVTNTAEKMLDKQLVQFEAQMKRCEALEASLELRSKEKHSEAKREAKQSGSHDGGLVKATFIEDGKFGITFGNVLGSDPGSSKVLKIDPNGLAAQQPQLKPGMVLIAIQGRPTKGKSLREASTEIKNAGRPITMTFTAQVYDIEPSKQRPQPAPAPAPAPAPQAAGTADANSPSTVGSREGGPDAQGELTLGLKQDQLALGRYVCPGIGLPGKISALRISNTHSKKAIHFHQVEIRGIDGVNHALCSNGGAAEQSSTHLFQHRAPAGAENLIDGDLSTKNCTEIQSGRASVTITLAQPQHIAKVVIYNIKDNRAPYYRAERAEGHELELIDEHGTVLTHIRLSRRFHPDLFGAQPAHAGTDHERKLVLGLTPGALFEARLRLHVMRVLSPFVDESHAVIDVLRCIERQLIALLGQRLMLPCLQQWTPGHGRAIENNRVWRNGTTELRRPLQVRTDGGDGSRPAGKQKYGAGQQAVQRTLAGETPGGTEAPQSQTATVSGGGGNAGGGGGCWVGGGKAEVRTDGGDGSKPAGMQKYRVISRWGEGTFAEVFKAQSVKTGRYTAMKCMKNKFDSVEQVCPRV
eukprot:COSAG05_NODE_212_length_13942_cov_18.039659_5_plen_1501_part_00